MRRAATLKAHPFREREKPPGEPNRGQRGRRKEQQQRGLKERDRGAKGGGEGETEGLPARVLTSKKMPRPSAVFIMAGRSLKGNLCPRSMEMMSTSKTLQACIVEARQPAPPSQRPP